MSADVVASFVRANRGLARPKRAWGRCFIEASKLELTLGAAGVSCTLLHATGVTYTRSHYGVLLLDPDGDWTDVVDVTARQFRADAAFPYVAPWEEWADDVTEWLQDGIDLTPDNGGPAERWIRDDVEPGPLRWAWEIAS